VSEKKEYIERGALIGYLGGYAFQYKHTAKLIMGAIEKFPAADVEPVVRGEWETDRDTIRCSVCGFGYFPHGYFFKDGQCVGDLIFVRCPECGAKMDGEKEGV
jgi:hypothetical protein